MDHGILLKKLKGYGITGNLHNWFTDYLRNRSQRVVIEGTASEWSSVTSGVSQGSILGPMLFLLFINDLPDVIPTTTSAGLYADDTKLYKSITPYEDCVQLQEVLTDAENWSKDSSISFNPSKCKVLCITRRKNTILAKYYLCSSEIKRVDNESDLDITVTYRLSWNNHINKIVDKANQMLGILKRYLTKDTLF